MAIQFNCPYCTATARVPDSAAGKQGRCPKCDSLIKIPELPVPGTTAAPVVPALQLEDTQPFPQQRVEPVKLPPPVLSTPAGGVETGPGIPIIQASDSSGAAQRYLKNRKKKHSFKVSQLAIPAGMIVILLGAVWGYLKYQEPSYEGQLNGVRLPAQISLESQFTATGTSIVPADWQAFLDDLRQAPVDLRSNLLAVRFTAADKGVQVFLNPGIEAEFVQVSVFEHAAVAKTAQAKMRTLEAARQEEIKQALEEFIQGHQARQEGDGSLLINYRDELALNSHRLGLGRRCEAVAAGVRYPCIHEDADGKLTFLVPVGTTAFTIQERTDLSDKSIFSSPLKLHVTVTQELAAPEETFIEPAPSAPVESPMESPSIPAQPDSVPSALSPEP